MPSGNRGSHIYPVDDHEDNAWNNDQEGNEKINVAIFDDVHCASPTNQTRAGGQQFYIIQQGMQESTGHNNGSEQTHNYAQSQGDRETFDHACSEGVAEYVKDQTGDQRGCI